MNFHVPIENTFLSETYSTLLAGERVFSRVNSHVDFKTLRGRLYRRRYQLVFFKTSAKDIKNTPSILVVQISVIHQLKL